jgi:hypothetical protein
VAAPKHLERLAIHHLSYAIRDGGYPVMQVGLPDRNIDRFVPYMAETRAPTCKRKKTKDEKQG